MALIPRGARTPLDGAPMKRGGALMLALAIALLPAPVSAQAPASITIDNVQVSGNGRHRVAVSVLDAAGNPVAGLADAFKVRLNDHDVESLVATPARTARPAATVTLVTDASLLRPPALADVQDAVRELARSLESNDRIRLIAAGDHLKSREVPAGGAERLASGLGDLADDGTPMLYDGLYQAVLSASHLPGSRAGAVLLLTRGADGGSRHTLIEVLALARTPTRLTRVMVVRLGDTGVGPETDRLRRLSAQAGGALVLATSSAGIAPVLPGLAARALDQWVLMFRASAWSADAERQSLQIEVEHDGARRVAASDYETRKAMLPPWWQTPITWLSLLALLFVAGIVFLLTRRRQLGLLVHDRDADDGVWYELFRYPVTIGAAAGNGIVLADGQISRNHAVLERRGRTVELVDLNSENGTFVNGERISRRTLADADRLSFGKAVHLIYEARG